MDKVKEVVTLCNLNFRKWFSSTRIKIILLLVVLLIYNNFSGVRLFAAAANVNVTPWGLPFLLSNFNNLIIIMFGYVFLYCNAPFIDEQKPYVILRSGRKIFSAAQILYIFVSSLIYAIFLAVATIVCSLPRVEFSPKWGKVFKTLAITSEGSQFNVALPVTEKITLNFTPIEAMVKQLLLLWLIGCFLGFLIFALNMHFPRFVGIGAASLFIFLDMFADFFRISHGYFSNRIYSFSPVSWANLTIQKCNPAEMLPTFTYQCTVLLMVITILVFIILLSFRKEEIEVIPQI